MNFYLGCAVWSYPGWVGNLYPPKSQPAEFLRLYSQRFTAVEGNTTFYATPQPKTVQRWSQETAAGFKFCVKLPASVTHQGLLAPRLPQALEFLERMQEFGDRLGPAFAQLPPHYSPARLNDLTTFLAAVSPRYALALEVRHPDWFVEPYSMQLDTLLKEYRVGTVVLDTRAIYSSNDSHLKAQSRKPSLPLHPKVTANFTLVRYISHPQHSQNQAYLAEWVKRVEDWLRQGVPVYFFVHCPEELHSPTMARYFQQMLEQQGVPVPPLPWNQEDLPEQLSLF
ncbi:MAG: DUF72 domain-containing protein [Cyanophyceae cyanobacterium]